MFNDIGRTFVVVLSSK